MSNYHVVAFPGLQPGVKELWVQICICWIEAAFKRNTVQWLKQVNSFSVSEVMILITGWGLIWCFWGNACHFHPPFFHPFRPCTSKDHSSLCLPSSLPEGGKRMGKVCSITSRGYIQRLNTSHWPPSGYMVTSSCKGTGRCGLWLTCTQPKLLKDDRETDVKPTPTQL